MKEYGATQEGKRMQWDARRILLGLPGWIMLSGAISSLLYLARSFADDAYYSSFIANWIPWIAVFFFMVGWLVAHGVEIAVLDMQIGMTRILEAVFLLIVMTLPWTVPALSSNPVFERLDSACMALMISGYFFRYSMFQKRSLWLFPGVLLGKKKDIEP